MRKKTSDRKRKTGEVEAVLHDDGGGAARDDTGRFLTSFCVVGVGVGILVSLFRYAITQAAAYNHRFYEYAANHPECYVALFGVVLGFAWFVSFVLKREPLIGGSGIPQVMGYLEDRIPLVWYRILFYKLVGGIVAIGSGLTVGREGPSVQVGAAVGQGVGEFASADPEVRKLHTVAGACSGIAVAFHTPVSAIVFAYEELKVRFSARNYLLISLAVMVSNFVSTRFFGIRPILAYALPAYDFLPTDYLVLCAVGVLAGLSGVLFNRSIAIVKKWYSAFRVPQFFKILFAFASTFFFIVYSIEFFGSGEHFIFLPVHGNASIWNVLIYYVVTLVLLLIAFCSGVPGGIFFPMLVIGSLLGNLCGLCLLEMGWISAEMVSILAVVTMAAHFAAIVRSPLTGMLLVVEMTGAFSFMLPLVIVVFFAYAAAESMRERPIYDLLLSQWLAQLKKGGVS